MNVPPLVNLKINGGVLWLGINKRHNMNFC